MARTGVFVCHCGTNIASMVDVEKAAELASQLPGVVCAMDYKYMCSDPGQKLIAEAIKEHNLDRVVVAACSPSLHEPTFRGCLENEGLNPYMLEIANVREQCSWVHTDREEATDKAIELIDMARAKVAHNEPLHPISLPVKRRALIIGGGISGIQAAIDIGMAGYEAVIVEREPSIGGRMAQFDKTFPTLDCAACILTPKMVTVSRDENIKVYTYAEVEEVSGHVGNFNVKIRRRARSVDADKCTGCGACWQKCPRQVPAEFDQGLGRRKAIYVPFPQAVPRVPVIDRDNCLFFQRGKCKLCEKACEAGAVDYSQEDEIVELDVGAVVVATGFAMWDPTQLPQYSHDLSPNIITGLEFERLSSAAGPTGGEIVTAEGKTPERVAIIHCVGSRDENAHPYCSRFCCMYSLKQAHLIHDKTGAEVFDFYMDMRAFGKAYEEFYERVQEEGITFIRGRGAEVEVLPDGKLRVKGEDADLGRLVAADVDLVVLATAIEPQPDSDRVAAVCGLGRTPDGFFAEAHPKLRPVETSTAGVFLAGSCQGPRDVPDTVTHAGAAALEVVRLFNQGEVTISPTVAEVDAALCVGCGECILTCPYTAIARDAEGKAAINAALCKGCGTCVATCPSGAITALHFTDEEIVAQIEGLLELTV